MNYKCVDGVIMEMTKTENNEQALLERKGAEKYWSQSYDILVNNEIRKQYTDSAEFAILRQKDEKPAEYKKYFDYCEHCKAYVKEKQAEYAR